MNRVRLAAALVLSTSVLGACGGGGDDEASSSSSSSTPAKEDSSAPAATGDEIDAGDFTFNVPDGWEEKGKEDLPGYDFVVLATDPGDTDGFSDNVNVVEDPTLTQVDDVDDLGKAVEKVLNGAAKDVKLEEPSTVDGDDAAVATATFTQNDVSYRTLQYAVAHDDKGYVITFSFSEDVPDAEQKKTAASVIASWAWAA